MRDEEPHDESSRLRVTLRIMLTLGDAARTPKVREEHVTGLRELLDELRRSREQTEADCDHGREQAAQAVKALPGPATVNVDGEAPRKSWWRRLAG